MSGAIAEVEAKKLSKKQAIALTYLAKGYTPRRTAKMIGMKLATVNKWMTDEGLFRDRLETRLVEIFDKDADYRKRNNIFFNEKINNEIHKKIKEGALKDEDLKTLFAYKSKVEGDIRADSPRTGDDTHPGGVGPIQIQIMVQQIKDRYPDATSRDLMVIDVEPEAKQIEQGG